MCDKRRKITDLTLSKLREYVYYGDLEQDPNLYWRKRIGWHYLAKVVNGWNGRMFGRKAGSAANEAAYASVSIEGNAYLLHRLIFMICNNIERYSDLPAVVDHVDRDYYNNRPSNLRASTSSLNVRNRKSIGEVYFKGVDIRKGKYRSRIIVNFCEVHLGMFDNAEDAARVYDAASHYCNYPAESQNFKDVVVELNQVQVDKINKAMEVEIKQKSSNMKGVTWNLKQQKFNATIRCNKAKKSWCAGSFDDETDAAMARNKFIIKNELDISLTGIPCTTQK